MATKSGGDAPAEGVNSSRQISAVSGGQPDERFPMD